MCDWVIHPLMLYPVKPEDFRELSTEEWGLIAYYGRCSCGGARDARVIELEGGAKRVELYCRSCEAVET